MQAPESEPDPEQAPMCLRSLWSRCCSRSQGFVFFYVFFFFFFFFTYHLLQTGTTYSHCSKLCFSGQCKHTISWPRQLLNLIMPSSSSQSAGVCACAGCSAPHAPKGSGFETHCSLKCFKNQCGHVASNPICMCGAACGQLAHAGFVHCSKACASGACRHTPAKKVVPVAPAMCACGTACGKAPFSGHLYCGKFCSSGSCGHLAAGAPAGAPANTPSVTTGSAAPPALCLCGPACGKNAFAGYSHCGKFCSSGQCGHWKYTKIYLERRTIYNTSIGAFISSTTIGDVDLIERICEIVAMQTGGDTLHFEMNAQLLQGAPHCGDVGRIKIFFFDNEGVTNPWVIVLRVRWRGILFDSECLLFLGMCFSCLCLDFQSPFFQDVCSNVTSTVFWRVAKSLKSFSVPCFARSRGPQSKWSMCLRISIWQTCCIGENKKKKNTRKRKWSKFFWWGVKSRPNLMFSAYFTFLWVFLSCFFFFLSWIAVCSAFLVFFSFCVLQMFFLWLIEAAIRVFLCSRDTYRGLTAIMKAVFFRVKEISLIIL